MDMIIVPRQKDGVELRLELLVDGAASPAASGAPARPCLPDRVNDRRREIRRVGRGPKSAGSGFHEGRSLLGSESMAVRVTHAYLAPNPHAMAAGFDLASAMVVVI